MKFLQAITTDGKLEYFNLNKILTISPISDDVIKILMGAGLYWTVERDSLKVWDMSNNEIERL